MDGHEAASDGLDEGLIGSLQQPTSLAIICTIFVVVLTTRFITGGSSTLKNGSKTPPLAPYWIPVLGHLPRLFFNPIYPLMRLRNRYPEGAFSIRVLSNIHTFVFRPALSDALLKQPSSIADDQHIVRRLMVSNFGLSTKDLHAYDKASKEVQENTKEFLANSHLSDITEEALRGLNEQAADLVSFNSFPIDQMEWERLSGAEKVDDANNEIIMEADYMELVKNFIARTSNASIFGTDFIENFPEVWHNLWAFDDWFITLARAIPIWVPWVGGQRARSPQRQLLAFMREYHEAWEKSLNGENPGPKWQDLHNASQLVKSRIEVFRKHELSLDIRAAYDVSLLWSVNASSAPLIAWSLLELNQDSVLLAQVREEISPYVNIVQPSHQFGTSVWVAPRIETIDLDALLTKCPLLKATYLETVRLYGGGWSSKWLKEDVVLEEDGKAACVLKKGSYAHVLHDLHHSDPKYFPNPLVWQARRHLQDSENADSSQPKIANSTTVRPYDGGLTLSDDSEFTLRRMLLYTAVIVSLYNFKPVNRGKWNVPPIAKGPVSSHPALPFRVWIKRRDV
ncbi:cytochrome P450 [Dactylonectria macrodidyma]|uniref:Cytochrome P450 n=1 Tax=Dactylonectria macrodidyma TaxID=307937 RepID=A0A9P9ETM7_9HYPO|nr:cytochrome P450 [Dactylonectria macrodidyma]